MIATVLLLLVVLVALGCLAVLLLAVYCPIAYRNGYQAGRGDLLREQANRSNVTVLHARSRA